MTNLAYDKNFLDEIAPALREQTLRTWENELMDYTTACKVLVRECMHLGHYDGFCTVQAWQAQAEAEIALINADLEALDE